MTLDDGMSGCACPGADGQPARESTFQAALDRHFDAVQQILDQAARKQELQLAAALRHITTAAARGGATSQGSQLQLGSAGAAHGMGAFHAWGGFATAQEEQASVASESPSRLRRVASDLAASGLPVELGRVYNKERYVDSGIVASEAVSSMSSFGREKTADDITKVSVKRRSFVYDIVESKAFELASALIILLNAVTIALGAEHGMAAARASRHPTDDAMELLELVFSLFYIAELLMRVWAHKLAFFCRSDWAWNVFDVLLVVAAFQGIILYAAGVERTAANVTVLRLARLLKVVRTLRMVRLLGAFRELRLMMNSVFGCVKSMVWGILLVFFTNFVFGVSFVQASTIYFEDHPDVGDVHSRIVEYYGSVPTAMVSLYMAVTNGDSWRLMAETLGETGEVFYASFLLYVAFFTFVVVNTLNSLFIEATLASQAKDQRAIIDEQLRNRETYIKQFTQIFHKFDDDGSGTIDMDELERHLSDKRMIAFMMSLELDPSDVRQFFNVLSHDGAYPVDLESFVVGCLKIKGFAKSMDLIGLANAQKRLTMQLCTDVQRCAERLEAVHCALLRSSPAPHPPRSPDPRPGDGA